MDLVCTASLLKFNKKHQNWNNVWQYWGSLSQNAKHGKSYVICVGPVRHTDLQTEHQRCLRTKVVKSYSYRTISTGKTQCNFKGVFSASPMSDHPVIVNFYWLCSEITTDLRLCSLPMMPSRCPVFLSFLSFHVQCCFPFHFSSALACSWCFLRIEIYFCLRYLDPNCTNNDK